MRSLETIEKERHGGPFDRGSADCYYRRRPDPHYWTHGTYHGERIGHNRMSDREIAEYYEGWDENEKYGDYKDYS